MTLPNPFRFAAAMWRAFLFWVRGEEVIVPEEVRVERLDKCLAPCPHLDLQSLQCRLCTCWVEVKVYLASEKCPDRRWKKWRSYLYFSRR